MVPTGIVPGNVIRIKSVVASVLSEFKNILVPTDHSNLLQIHKSFKLFTKFHNKVENTEYDLSKAVLGCQSDKIITEARQDEALKRDGQVQVIVTGAVTGQMPLTGQAPSAFGGFLNDHVLEKPEIVSNVGSLYKNYTIMSIADILFSMPNEIQ